jgi:hypothetical protein
MYDYRNDIIEKQAEIIKSLQEEFLERAEFELSLLKTIAVWERQDTENRVLGKDKILAELETKNIYNKMENCSELQKEFEEFTQLMENEKNV